MADVITPAVSDRICKHMNEDHGETIVLYARAFGNAPDAESAKMLAIDPQGMDLMAQIGGQETPVRVKFDRTLKDSEDAHQTLIAMVKQARQSKV